MAKRFVRPGVTLAYSLLLPPDAPESPPAGVASPLPVILVCGLGSTKEDWHTLATDLARDRVVLILDNRGIGESSAASLDGLSIEDMADDVLALARHAGLRRYHVLGASMGGMIAQHVALRAEPGVVAGLVLACTHHGGANAAPPSPAFLERLVAAMRTRRSAEGQGRSAADRAALGRRVAELNFTPEEVAEGREEFERVVATSLSTRRPARTVAAQSAAVASFDVAARLASLASPALVIHGDADGVVPFANAEMLVRGLPNAELVALPRTGHALWLTQPKHASRAARQFLARCDGAAKYPWPRQLDSVVALAGESDAPLTMLNILKYADAAEYATYAAGMADVLRRLGGGVVWSGTPRAVVIGDERALGGRHHTVALVRYPSAQAFVRMQTDPQFLRLAAHRARGLESQWLIACEEHALPGAAAAVGRHSDCDSTSAPVSRL